MRLEIDGQDFTSVTNGLDQLNDIQVGLNENNTVEVVTSTELALYGPAFTYLESKLFNDEITDFCEQNVIAKLILSCCKERELNFIIRFDSITGIDYEECTVRLTLATATDLQGKYKCLKNRIYWKHDNFVQNVEVAKVAYCTDFGFQNSLFAWLYLALLPLLAFLQAVEGFINALLSIPIIGNALGFETVDLPSLDNLANSIQGCGKQHPSPYLLSLLKESCKACGLEFSSTILENAPYSDIVFFQAQYEEGISYNSSTKLIEGNLANLTVLQLLDLLNPVFNADYRIKKINGSDTLVFERKDFFRQSPIILFDVENQYKEGKIFADTGPVYNIIQDKQKKAYARYQYQTDPVDVSGNNRAIYYNDIIEWNPDGQLECRDGEQSNVVEFAPAAFQKDQRASEIADNLIRGFNLPGSRPYLNNMLLTTDSCENYKLIIIDPSTKSEEVQKIVRRDIGDDRNEYNYPMYFDESSTDGLYQNFHVIDDPQSNVTPNYLLEDITVAITCQYLDDVFDRVGDIALSTRKGNAFPEGGVSLDFEKMTMTFKGLTI